MFANPFNSCNECGERVVDMNSDATNVPCGHKGGFTSKCPSWSPVDSCNCRPTCELPPMTVPDGW